MTSTTALRSAVIIDDHPLVLQGLRLVLPSLGYGIIGEASNGHEGMSVAIRMNPSIVVCDFRLPDMTASDVCSGVRASGIDSEVIVLTGFAEPAPLYLCLRNGAKAIVLKDTPLNHLGDVLRRIEGGETVVDSRLGIGKTSNAVAYAHDLTPRDYDVLRLLARGKATSEIASELFLTVNTVRSYVQSVLDKLGARSRIEAVIKAQHLGLI